MGIVGLCALLFYQQREIGQLQDKTQDYARALSLVAISLPRSTPQTPWAIASEAVHRLVSLQEVREAVTMVEKGEAKTAMILGKQWRLVVHKRDKNGKFARG